MCLVPTSTLGFSYTEHPPDQDCGAITSQGDLGQEMFANPERKPCLLSPTTEIVPLQLVN